MVRAIGIDLGTTYTVVSVIEGGRPKIVPNAEGQRLTPSVVAFTKGGRTLVGQPAKNQAAARPDETVFSIKRQMGSDHTVRVARGEYTPQAISSLILGKVKADVESRLGEAIDQAVITVPAYFNDRQRQATKEAGLLAGLTVIGIINEPTAAALAYGLEREDAQTILVWDLGGGTFDVSILELGEGIFEVKAVSGDTWLGGDDIDRRLMDYLAQEYQRLTGAALPEDARSRQRLKEAAEKAKIQLSSSPRARLRLPPVDGPGLGPLEVAVTRERLESLIEDLLQRMVVATHRALSDARLTPEDIDRVILVGGATRMPPVRALVRETMGKRPYCYLDPDEVVATGAAIRSGMLLGLVEKAVLLDVLPLSLGVETQGGLVAKIIPRNTPLPASGSRIFTTAADYQTSMDIQVLQGERALAGDNISLGRFQIGGIPSAPRGVPKVEVSFEADNDGIIHVSATDLLSENWAQVKLVSTKLVDRREIDLRAEEARLKAKPDREKRDGIQAHIEAETLIAAAEKALSEVAGAPADIPPPIAQAMSRVKEALASGTAANLRAHSQALQALLAAQPWGKRPAVHRP